MNLSNLYNSFFSALLLTCWSLFPTIIGVLLSSLAFKKKWSFSYYNLIVAASIPALIAFLHINAFVFGTGRKDAQDGIVFMVLPFFLCTVFIASILIGAILYFVGKFIFYVNDKENIEPTKNYAISIYWLVLPLFFCVLYFGAAWTMTLRNTYHQSIEESISESDLRNAYAESKGDFGVLFTLSQNSNTPSDILELLSTNEYPSIRTFVAKNPNTPTLIIEKMSNEENNCIRQIATKELIRRGVAKEQVSESCR